MQTTTVIANLLVAFLAASPAAATPALFRRQVCNSTPSLAADASVKPLAQPVVTTADLCRQACEANASCQAYVFGLPASATSPECMLFAVPAAQVPAQGFDELHVFDKACTSVPNVAPTHASPQGTRNNNGATTPATGNNNGNNNNGQGQAGNNNNGRAQTGGSNNGQPQQGQRQKRNQCGATPAGPSSSSPTPLQTLTTPADLPACLALCKASPSCKSVEFGRPAPNQAPQCLLFSVSASELPRPASGATFVASDVGC